MQAAAGEGRKNHRTVLLWHYADETQCDETRPCCQKCEKLGLECTYEAILPPGYGKKDIDSALVARVFSQRNAATLDATAHSLAVSAVTTQVDEVLQLSSTMTKSKGCLSNLEILRHFQDIFTPNTMIINETGKDAMRVKMIRLALQVIAIPISLNEPS